MNFLTLIGAVAKPHAAPEEPGGESGFLTWRITQNGAPTGNDFGWTGGSEGNYWGNSVESVRSDALGAFAWNVKNGSTVDGSDNGIHVGLIAAADAPYAGTSNATAYASFSRIGAAWEVRKAGVYKTDGSGLGDGSDVSFAFDEDRYLQLLIDGAAVWTDNVQAPAGDYYLWTGAYVEGKTPKLENATYSTGGGGSSVVTPPDPTNFIVDDDANTGTFTPATGYAATAHEYQINGGSIQDCTSNVIAVGDVAAATGQVKVRVKAVPGVNAASNWLTNGSPFFASSGGGAGYVTDRTLVVPVEPYPTYASNTPFTDPNFGLTSNIIAKPSDFGGVVPNAEYSQQLVFNLDNTFCWIALLNGEVKYAAWDEDDVSHGSWQTLTDAKSSSVWWSGVTPGLIWYCSLDGKKLYKKRVDLGTAAVEVANLETLLGGAGTGTFAGQVFLANGDDSYLSGVVQPNGSATKATWKWFLLRLSDNTVLKNELIQDEGSTAGIEGANDVHCSPLGTWIYICSNAGGTKSEVQQIYHRPSDTIFNFGIRGQTANDLWGNGHNDLGETYIVGEGRNGNDIIATDMNLLLTGGSVAAGIAAFRAGGVEIYKSNYIAQNSAPTPRSAGHHVCYKGGDWALISCYDQRTTAQWGNPTTVDTTQDEVFLAKVTIPNSSSKEIRRFAKHHGISHTADGSFNYNKLPRGSISPDGAFVAFNSTLDVENGDTAVVVVKLPGAP
ncbi:MAG TPA: hypothetical protein VIL74_09125 [Pyrinomonadaceae bacterium]|jgi:hypothetical protein